MTSKHEMLKAFSPAESERDGAKPTASDQDEDFDDVEDCARQLERALGARHGGTWSMIMTAQQNAVLFIKG